MIKQQKTPPWNSCQQAKHKSGMCIPVRGPNQELGHFQSTRVEHTATLSPVGVPEKIFLSNSTKHMPNNNNKKIPSQMPFSESKNSRQCRGRKQKQINTQRLLARTVCFTVLTNWSVEGAGMHILSAPICIRRAFCSGRKSKRRPSSFL